MTPLFLVLLNLLAVGHASKNCFESEGANCYYIHDPCPGNLEDCSNKFACSVATNKCCCPKSGTSTGSSPSSTQSCFKISGANCYFIHDPCPSHLEDCSQKFACSLATNKCCCPKSGTPSVPPTGSTPSPTPSPTPSSTPKPKCWKHPSKRANCFWKYEPCPWGLRDCSTNYACTLSTNKCCCP